MYISVQVVTSRLTEFGLLSSSGDLMKYSRHEGFNALSCLMPILNLL